MGNKRTLDSDFWRELAATTARIVAAQTPLIRYTIGGENRVVWNDMPVQPISSKVTGWSGSPESRRLREEWLQIKGQLREAA